MKPFEHLQECSLTINKQGAIFSSIGRGINSIISAIANVLMTIVGAITSVRSSTYHHPTKGTKSSALPLIDNCNYIRSHSRYPLLSMLRVPEEDRVISQKEGRVRWQTESEVLIEDDDGFRGIR